MNIIVESATVDAENGNLLLRTQDTKDIAKLAKAVPLDQTVEFTGKWEAGLLVLTAKSQGVPSTQLKVNTLSDEDLETRLAELNVKVAKNASIETKRKKLAEAEAALPPAAE